MFQQRPTSRQDFIHHLQAYHMDTCDVALVPKPSTDGRSGDFDANDGARAHSSLLTFLSPVLKEKLKGLSRSSEGNYIVSVDIDVSTQGIQAFVNCLYGKLMKAPIDSAAISEALKLASLYQAPIFVFEELFSNKTVFLCLAECLKRDKEEVEHLLESCKEMLQTNHAIYDDKSLFQDLNLDLFHWLAALEELPIPNLTAYLINFAMDDKYKSLEVKQVLEVAKSVLEKCQTEVSEVLKIQKSGNDLPPENFSIGYKNQTISEVLSKASSYSSEKFSPEHSRVCLQQHPGKELPITSHLADLEIKPGDIVVIEVKNQMGIRMMDGKLEKIFVDFNVSRVRDLKVQISDLLGTKDINTICLMKGQELLDDMQKLKDVFKEVDDKVVSALISTESVDADRVVVGYGEDNVAAWPGVVITADSYQVGKEPVKALLDSTKPLTFWVSEQKGSTAERWWQMAFAFPVVIGSFQFSAGWRRDDTHHHVDFKSSDFKIEGSVDEENWTSLISEEGIDEWVPAVLVKTFTCQNVKAFRFYRITSLKTTDPTSVFLLGELVVSESMF